MALQRVFPIIDVFIYLHCCKAGQAAPRNSNSIFDLLDKWVRYQMNGRANKWAKPQIWTCWEHMKPPTATANLLLASFHSGSHLCLSGMPISLACWPHYSPTLQLLNPQPALETPPPKKNTCQFISASRCLTLGMKRTFFFVIIWFTWTLSISRQWGGQ